MLPGITGLLFSYLLLLAIPAQPAHAHEQKTALTDILFNYRTGNLEIAHRLSTHDAEHTLYKVTGLDAELSRSTQALEAFAKYVEGRFLLGSEDKPKWKLEMVGQELERGFLWIYQETAIPTSASFFIENKILHNIIKGQVNTVNIRNRGKVSTFAFEANTGKVRYTAPAGRIPRPSKPGVPIRVAFVTNVVADFWNIAKAGCHDAGKELGVQVEVRMPSSPTVENQQRIVEDLIASGIQGIAISPLDPNGQKAWLDKVANQVPLITHDSDAPGSKRLCYIGFDNYKAGRMCGELLKEAIPDGGEVVLFVGRLGIEAADSRRQGVIDELLGRPNPVSLSFDPKDDLILGQKYTILETQVDGFSPDQAFNKALDALQRHPNLSAMVGLLEYNTPACYKALKKAGKLGEIALVGFDANDHTLQGIQEGHIVGTVVQNPYQYGYLSVLTLAKFISDEIIPAHIDIPARKIRRGNVAPYWTDLKSKLGK